MVRSSAFLTPFCSRPGTFKLRCNAWCSFNLKIIEWLPDAGGIFHEIRHQILLQVGNHEYSILMNPDHMTYYTVVWVIFYLSSSENDIFYPQDAQSMGKIFVNGWVIFPKRGVEINMYLKPRPRNLEISVSNSAYCFPALRMNLLHSQQMGKIRDGDVQQGKSNTKEGSNMIAIWLSFEWKHRFWSLDHKPGNLGKQTSAKWTCYLFPPFFWDIQSRSQYKITCLCIVGSNCFEFWGAMEEWATGLHHGATITPSESFQEDTEDTSNYSTFTWVKNIRKHPFRWVKISTQRLCKDQVATFEALGLSCLRAQWLSMIWDDVCQLVDTT